MRIPSPDPSAVRGGGARRRTLLCAALVLSFACALRLPPLFSYELSGEPLFWDPAVHVARAVQISRHGPFAPDLHWGRANTYPPGFALLLAVADGARHALGLGGDTLGTFYLANALLTALPAVAVFLLVRKGALGDGGGLVSALVVAASPLEVENALLGRTPSALAVAATVLAFVALDSRRAPHATAALAALAGAAVSFVHPPLSFGLFLGAMLAWAFAARREGLARRALAAAGGSVVLAAPGLLALGTPWLSFLVHSRALEPRLAPGDLAILGSPPVLALAALGVAGAFVLRAERSTRVFVVLTLVSVAAAVAGISRDVTVRALQLALFALSAQAGAFLWGTLVAARGLPRGARAAVAAVPVGALVCFAWPSLVSCYAPASRLPAAYLGALRWLARETEPDARVAAWGRLGWWVPALTARTALIAGVPRATATPDVYELLADLDDLYTGDGGFPDSLAVLREHRIDYLVAQPSLPARLWLPDDRSVEEVFSDDEVIVYRVTRSE